MQNDIVAPKLRRRPNSARTSPMRSQRLRGYTLDTAKARLRSDSGSQSEDNIESIEELDQTLPPAKPAAPPPKPPRKIFFWHYWHEWSRRRKIFFSAASTLVLLLIIFGAYEGFFHKTKPKAKTVVKTAPAPPVPTTVASPLTGVQVSPAEAARPVTGIMIENSLDARPQSGIQDAGVVFEAIAEGGITRFLTLYQESRPQYIGPVRSLRPYYIDWASAFDASIAHVGGSPEALAQIRSGGKDLDQFFNADSYWRVDSRPAPHNVYTSFDKLDGLNQSKGYTTSKFTPWPRKAEHPLATPTIISIDVNIASFYFNSHYDYDKGTNSYFRYEGGQFHKITKSADDSAGEPLHPKVLVVMVTNYGIDPDGQHSDYQTTGSGDLFVFQDGGVSYGKWSKADRPSQIVFNDNSGQPIKLDPGQTWVVTVGAANLVSYK